ncbi:MULTISPECIES: proline--tRNA ligase [unclassified Fusibacter]|uniref:proline--tRNA ligase n=1 Tax=unclassified Fusibacter TaxID=2624464 RepID=UPI0010127197|nr:MULTISPECIES: proline--tRNA ligase [unclassified Fusibacter]MCK8061195.1 proline--tRNA ligase [Fusibacter sp. A2]NPE23268.1 proline--tRNA ligase [Fusibacter sp. A1]RXV59312.1 proline--tRNA ligase [Fusibacter sp. A1]
MKMSKLYAPTLREVPSEAELPSHQLLLRAGMVRMLAAGIYTYLPLGHKVIKNIERIVREEMDAIDSQESLMSAMIPSELWKETGRWADFGPEMFKLYDRHNREFCLGPTHEEVFTDLIRHEVKSYKQLPLSLYQIQTKYRDEKRPRFGLMRCREFIMKDAYTFDKDEAGMKEAYESMWKAYERVFDRCGLNYKVVEGDAGAMGGSDSHEFIALSEIGETQIVYCESCDYAATDEKADVVYEVASANFEALELEKVSTPDTKTIEELKSFFGLSEDCFVKTLLYNVQGKTVAVMIPGDRELNEIKLINFLDCAEHELEMADEETVKAATGAEVGYAGPIGLNGDIRLVVDERITKMVNVIVGANQTDFHFKNVNYGRDFKGEIATDLLLVREGDNCPKCNTRLSMDRGNEVGNIFQLGTKYSKSLGATYLDANGKEQLIVMGSHGIGVSRTMAAIIEQSYDENGIIWPVAVAPYKAIVTVVNSKKEDQQELGFKIYEELKARGVEVIIDDRIERAGVKFKDAELIGIPFAINVGKNAEQGIVEFKERSKGEKIELTTEEAIAKVIECLAL